MKLENKNIVIEDSERDVIKKSFRLLRSSANYLADCFEKNHSPYRDLGELADDITRLNAIYKSCTSLLEYFSQAQYCLLCETNQEL